ncbi:MAG TPA: radical SAM protein [Terracidiphilus sp.]|nr:radical SAM protein [Terracidiphilus sp.]
MAKTDSLFPILNDKTISPLAHRAAEAQLDSAGCLTEYRPLESRSILSKVNSKRGAPFSHGINPYRGCEFACRYCYARYTHEFLEMRDPQEFERKIYFKENAAWLLEQELRRLKPGTQIAMGTATDPYQPLERKQKITRSLLEVFAKFSGFTLGIVTKSTLIARDVDLLQAIAERNKLTVHHTVTTLNVRLARILEPRAPRPDLRIATLAKVRAAGVRAGVLCSPLMPGITDSRSSIAAVAKAAAGAGANFFAAGSLFLKPCSLPTFFAFVREHFPEQLPAYEKRYAKSAFTSAEYQKRMADLVESVCREYKLGKRFSDQWKEETRPKGVERVEIQPWLPFAATGS